LNLSEWQKLTIPANITTYHALVSSLQTTTGAIRQCALVAQILTNKYFWWNH